MKVRIFHQGQHVRYCDKACTTANSVIETVKKMELDPDWSWDLSGTSSELKALGATEVQPGQFELNLPTLGSSSLHLEEDYEDLS